MSIYSPFKASGEIRLRKWKTWRRRAGFIRRRSDSVMRLDWHGLAGASIGAMTSNASYSNMPVSGSF
jgi:hypothetical protein